MVAHIVFVVHLAVEQLHANGDAVIFSDLFHAIRSDDRVAGAFLIGHTLPVSRKSNHVRHSRLCSQRDVFSECCLNHGMVLYPVQAVRDVASARISHTADQAIPARHLILLRLEQIDGLQADPGRISAKFVQRYLRIAPFADRLVNTPLALNRRIPL